VVKLGQVILFSVLVLFSALGKKLGQVLIFSGQDKDKTGG
jgi:hypothetical protein